MILDVKNPSMDQVTALLKEWETDCVVDRLEPSAELKKIPKLHHKYLTILSVHRRALKEAERRMTKLRKVKYEYYAGRLDNETLKKNGWTPFPFTLKSDWSTYMDSDTDLLNGKRVMEVHEEIIRNCESILKELGARTFQIRDIIIWERFISGVH